MVLPFFLIANFKDKRRDKILKLKNHITCNVAILTQLNLETGKKDIRFWAIDCLLQQHEGLLYF